MWASGVISEKIGQVVYLIQSGAKKHKRRVNQMRPNPSEMNIMPEAEFMEPPAIIDRVPIPDPDIQDQEEPVILVPVRRSQRNRKIRVPFSPEGGGAVMLLLIML